ncbi:hypothetical protein GOB42_27050 [Sinorhizobium meliloti]|uniref:hypothetical protein n=1 Tax=Rhizobium meliloti TaxID=382 RepID=UPI0001E4B07F|nr:hypothetical protein [Sinorhizobium meliloti]AEG54053.1 hypothetical protein Sinme_2336 [Sinorhizobium meliloti AK83]MDW9794376.1 hypothetical protein [Sinorhizobium meliloti]MDX0107383.1 hypothetical protein [Sinorhizobium meliloti]MDX0136431.1 hypothetical protein [Sinorhizobium meliloti]MDX0379748.1 hypothetical protein [Sinorhizobium meliloti]
MNFHENLPSLVNRAASQLANAVSAAEVLEASYSASVAYDAAKKAARFAKAKGAHDQLIAAAHRAQADALEIESLAKRRLANEYDAAQERGEVARKGKPVNVPDGNIKATAADIGLSRKDVHEARLIRDAEKAEPGLVRRALDRKVAARQEPTRAALRREVIEAAKIGGRAPSIKNPLYRAPTKAGAAWTHLYGACRALSEWTAQGENMELARRGMVERTDDQAANIAAVRKCAAALGRFLEEL